MFQIYENQGKEIETKVQDIYEALQRIDSLEKELHNFRATVASFGKQWNSDIISAGIIYPYC